VEKHSSEKVIKSLAYVTQHADREVLETSLASSLYNLLSVPRIILYKIFYNTEQIECYCSIKVEDDETHVMDAGLSTEAIEINAVPGLENCIETKDTVLTETDTNQYVMLYPTTNQFNQVVSIFRIDTYAEQKINEELISGYFQIYKNYLKLLDESERDTLTGLLNRRTFERDLQKVLTEKNNQMTYLQDDGQRRSDKDNYTHWLAVTDIDFFKRVNDNFGHLYGDEVLLLMANLMRESFRGNDILFRFGGEEFVIILRSTSKDGAYQALERFRRTVEEYDFPQVGRVTTSLGYVEIAENSIPTEILGFADEALYFSKDNGRNQLNQYEKLIADGHLTSHQSVVDDIELF